MAKTSYLFLASWDGFVTPQALYGLSRAFLKVGVQFGLTTCKAAVGVGTDSRSILAGLYVIL